MSNITWLFDMQLLHQMDSSSHFQDSGAYLMLLLQLGAIMNSFHGKPNIHTPATPWHAASEEVTLHDAR
jgi:hypothetical protein